MCRVLAANVSMRAVGEMVSDFPAGEVGVNYGIKSITGVMNAVIMPQLGMVTAIMDLH